MVSNTGVKKLRQNIKTLPFPCFHSAVILLAIYILLNVTAGRVNCEQKIEKQTDAEMWFTITQHASKQRSGNESINNGFTASCKRKPNLFPDALPCILAWQREGKIVTRNIIQPVYTFQANAL